MHELKAGETHFVRCVKPNDKNAPRQLIPKMVLEQLRASGVFDAVELMKKGYPTRIPYSGIHGKFAHSLPEDLAALSPSAFSELAALACDVGPKDYALGRNQLFLKADKGGLLEVRELQKATRVLQLIMTESKSRQDIPVAARVPKTRKALEAFVLRVKRLMNAHKDEFGNSENLFWVRAA